MTTLKRRHHPQVKRDDPLASFQAAWRNDEPLLGMTPRKVAVLWTMKLLGGERITNDEIEDAYVRFNEVDPERFPLQKPQGIRSRRSELEEMGCVYECDTQKPNREGTPVTCWSITSRGWG